MSWEDILKQDSDELMPNEKIEEILNNAEAMLPKIEKEGGEYMASQVEKIVSRARLSGQPDFARSMYAKALERQMKNLDDITYLVATE